MNEGLAKCQRLAGREAFGKNAAVLRISSQEIYFKPVRCVVLLVLQAL